MGRSRGACTLQRPIVQPPRRGSHLSLSCPHQEPGQLHPLPCPPGPQVGTKPYNDQAWLSDEDLCSESCGNAEGSKSADLYAKLGADRGQALLLRRWSSNGSIGDPMQLTAALQDMAVRHHHAQLPGPSGIPGGSLGGCLHPQGYCALRRASEGCSLAAHPQPVRARHTLGVTLRGERAKRMHKAKCTAG